MVTIVLRPCLTMKEKGEKCYYSTLGTVATSFVQVYMIWNKYKLLFCKPCHWIWSIQWRRAAFSLRTWTKHGILHVIHSSLHPASSSSLTCIHQLAWGGNKENTAQRKYDWKWKSLRFKSKLHCNMTESLCAEHFCSYLSSQHRDDSFSI